MTAGRTRVGYSCTLCSSAIGLRSPIPQQELRSSCTFPLAAYSAVENLLLPFHRRRDVRFLAALSHPRNHLVFVELIHGGQLNAAGGAAHAGRCHWRFWLQFVPSDEHQLQVTDKGAGREASPIGN